jgi:prolyl oligopeptidase
MNILKKSFCVVSGLGLFALVAILVFSSSTIAQKLHYPVTKKVDQVDTYFGIKVADPYRWLEDDNSAETAQWVQAQNAVTFGYLEKIPYRQQVKQRLEKLYNYPKDSVPWRKREYYFSWKNTGLQNQDVVYIQKGLSGTPEVLLDPNTLSKDGTARLMSFEVSKDAKYAAYGVSQSGSDWVDLYIIDLATKKPLSDTLRWIKFSGAAWQGNGFYYARFDAPEQGKTLSSRNVGSKVYYHAVGTPQSQDELIFEDKAHPDRLHFVGTTEDERFAVLYVSESSAGKKGNALYYRDDSKDEKTFRPVVSEISDDSFGVIQNVGDTFLLTTNRNAPNNKVVQFDPRMPAEKDWKVILAEKPEPLQTATTAGEKLFVTYLKDVTTRVSVYGLDGTLENEVQLPSLGLCGGFAGQRDDKFVFYGFTTFTFPVTIYQYDIAAKKSTVFWAPKIAGFDPKAYVTEQVFYQSKDGTRVPMFIVHKPGLKKDGTNPTLLYGYGGFNASIQPYFDPLLIALLEQGFVYASANMRGGGEYGEKWHDAGAKLNKQNVFDDFIAAAEYLIANKYTSSAKLAIHGESNGGLLIGAVTNQRPDLFKVSVAEYGVMDMLRFHKFTIGAEWIADYGSSDNEEQFRALLKYSPLHNVRSGTAYPAVLITTADHDDRVVPAHSFKYAATMQEKAAGENPILIRIETRSGHGSSSTTKYIENTADAFSFLFFNLGVMPKY